MPLVLVHGVSNRDTPEYRDNRLARDTFLRELVAPELGLATENFQIFNPYWDRVPRPVNVKRWLNVLDLNDVFSFRAEGVFDGVTDFRYETGYGAMAAHSGYFRRPSFNERLSEQPAEGEM